MNNTGISGYEAKRRQAWILFLLPALIVYTVFMAFPLVNSMRLSFYTGQGLTPDHFVGFANYIALFTNPLLKDKFFNALGNTFVFFAIHMLVQNTLGLLFATLLSSALKGGNIYRTLIFIPATMPIVVTGFLWQIILNPRWGAVNQFLEAIGLGNLARPWLGDPALVLIVISLVSSWQWVGLHTMMFLAGFLTIPDELIEAARIDGASSWLTFWKVKLPLLTPVIGLVSVLTFVGNFNAFDIIFAMAGTRGEPGYAADLLATFFYRTGLAGEPPAARPDMGVGAAVATVTFVILLVGVSMWLIPSRRRAQDY